MSSTKVVSSSSNATTFSATAEYPAKEPPPRAAWRIDDAAYRMGISRVSIYKLAKEGKIKLLKIAGRTLVPDAEIVRLTTPQNTEAA